MEHYKKYPKYDAMCNGDLYIVLEDKLIYIGKSLTEPNKITVWNKCKRFLYKIANKI